MMVAIDEEKDLDRGIPPRRVHGYKLWHVRDRKRDQATEGLQGGRHGAQCV